MGFIVSLLHEMSKYLYNPNFCDGHLVICVWFLICSSIFLDIWACLYQTHTALL